MTKTHFNNQCALCCDQAIIGNGKCFVSHSGFDFLHGIHAVHDTHCYILHGTLSYTLHGIFENAVRGWSRDLVKYSNYSKREIKMSCEE